MAIDTFTAACETYFDVLCETLSLEDKRFEEGERVSAASGNVRVYLECDRGLCAFAIGAGDDVQPLCGIEEIAQRFPRTRAIPEGYQRLSLEEQCTFLRQRWTDLQIMFSKEHIQETRRWRAAAAAATMKKFTRKS